MLRCLCSLTGSPFGAFAQRVKADDAPSPVFGLHGLRSTAAYLLLAAHCGVRRGFAKEMKNGKKTQSRAQGLTPEVMARFCALTCADLMNQVRASLLQKATTLMFRN